MNKNKDMGIKSARNRLHHTQACHYLPNTLSETPSDAVVAVVTVVGIVVDDSIFVVFLGRVNECVWLDLDVDFTSVEFNSNFFVTGIKGFVAVTANLVVIDVFLVIVFATDDVAFTVAIDVLIAGDGVFADVVVGLTVDVVVVVDVVVGGS